MIERLKAELTVASAELNAHLASWEYAFAMGNRCEGAAGHPKHVETRARTERLLSRYRDLRALVSEHELS